MKFSIVTTSFRHSAWLKLCIASVADQQGVEFEHIVQDACSDDGTQDWLPYDARVRAFIEEDDSMYKAINRGYQRAQGDILAYLNCDEQYLPGALQAIREFFQQHPDIEVVLAGTIVVDSNGNYMCHRHSLVPNRYDMWFRFPVLTSSIFLRRRVVHERGIVFDPRWRAVGDFHCVRALMAHRVPMSVFNFFTPTFADTSQIIMLTPAGVGEFSAIRSMAPGCVRLLEPLC